MPLKVRILLVSFPAGQTRQIFMNGVKASACFLNSHTPNLAFCRISSRVLWGIVFAPARLSILKRLLFDVAVVGRPHFCPCAPIKDDHCFCFGRSLLARLI